MNYVSYNFFFILLLEGNCFTMLLVSAVWQHESAVCTQTPLPLEPPSQPTPSDPSRPSQSTERKSWAIQKLPISSLFHTWWCIYANAALPVLPTLPPTESTSPFSMSTYLFLPCKQVPLYHFSGLHIYALIYNIFFSF